MLLCFPDSKLVSVGSASEPLPSLACTLYHLFCLGIPCLVSPFLSLLCPALPCLALTCLVSCIASPVCIAIAFALLCMCCCYALPCFTFALSCFAIQRILILGPVTGPFLKHVCNIRNFDRSPVTCGKKVHFLNGCRGWSCVCLQGIHSFSGFWLTQAFG